jgi:hypothetical protein
MHQHQAKITYTASLGRLPQECARLLQSLSDDLTVEASVANLAEEITSLKFQDLEEIDTDRLTSVLQFIEVERQKLALLDQRMQEVSNILAGVRKSVENSLTQLGVTTANLINDRSEADETG